MAKTNLYTVYDTEAQTAIGPLIAELRDAPAIRNFNEILSDERSILHKYPNHFRLVHLGAFDTETLEITPATPAATIYSGAEWLAAQRRAVYNSGERQNDDASFQSSDGRTGASPEGGQPQAERTVHETSIESTGRL